jgi:hypothetical protein
VDPGTKRARRAERVEAPPDEVSQTLVNGNAVVAGPAGFQMAPKILEFALPELIIEEKVNDPSYIVTDHEGLLLSNWGVTNPD